MFIDINFTINLKMDWESFYDTHPSPSNYESIINIVEHFVCSHENEKIALVTVSISAYKHCLWQINLI